MNDLISVIVPVYNVDSYLRECLDSILEQTYRNIEVIVVDDGSTDGSSSICDEYAKIDNRIVVTHQENGGPSSARNAGVALAKGKYIAFVDSDDVVSKRILEILSDIIKENDCDISVCQMTENQNEIGQKKKLVLERFDFKEAVKQILIEDKLNTSACAKLFKRELFDGVIFPEGLIYEDFAKIYKVLLKAKKITLCNLPLYYYRDNKMSITKKDFDETRMQYFAVSNQVKEEIKGEYPDVEQLITNRETRYAISFYKQISEIGYKNEKIKQELRKRIKENIKDYYKSSYKLSSKMYGTLIIIMPKLAEKIFRK